MLTIMPPIGIVLFISALRPFAQTRTRVTSLNMVAATCFAMACVLWPDSTSIRLDHTLGVSGFGFAVSRVAITFAAVIHAIAVSISVGLWDRRHQLLLLPAVTIASLLFVACWLLAHAFGSGVSESAFYGGYHGRPLIIFWVSIARGVTIITYSVYAVYIYSVLTARTRSMWRWTAAVTGLAFSGSILDGLAVIASALAEHAHMSSPTFLTLTSVLVIGCCGLIMVVYVMYTNVRPLWLLVQEVRHLPAERAQLERVRDNVLELNLRLDDKIVLLHSYADPDIEREVREHCANLPSAEQEVIRMAARLITLAPENIHRLRLPGDQSMELAEAAVGAQYFAELAESDLYFYGDVYLVAALALGADAFGVPLYRTPDDWHRRLARILRETIDHYQQPPEKLSAYRQAMEGQAAARADLMDAMFTPAAGTPS